jgi:soluble lytic murein transglycosylase-like protein
MNPEDRYDSLFRFYGEAAGVDWRLLKAQVKAESDFDPDARSRVGAAGLAQFMARTWDEWRDGTAGIQYDTPSVDLVMLDPRDPEDAIRAQAAMMAWLFRTVGGVLAEALAAYNWGIGNLRRLKMDHPASWRSELPIETRNYIARIDRFYADYRAAA